MTMKFIMPEQGQGWRHYKGQLYTIIGVGPDHDGVPTVAYTPYNYMTPSDAPIYFQPLGRFLQEIEPAGGFNAHDGPKGRFRFDREADGDRCRYVGPRLTARDNAEIRSCIAMLDSAVKSGAKWDDTLQMATEGAMFLLTQR